MLPMGIAPSARAASVPVIIRAADGELADAQALIEGLGGTVEHEVGIINGFIGTMPHDHLDDLDAARRDRLRRSQRAGADGDQRL